MDILAVALGGAIGAVLRFLVNTRIGHWLGSDFPWGIFIINVSGSLVLGFLTVLLFDRDWLSMPWREGLLVGVLGAFTTFSTYSLQTVSLVESGRVIAAAAYAFGSLTACVAAAGLGVLLARQLN